MDPKRPTDSLLPNPRFGQIPPNPRGSGHRRAQSETFIRFPDDILFDSDPDFGLTDIEFPSLSDDNGSTGSGFPIAVDSGRSDPSIGEQGKAGRPTGGAHLRSLSVDAAFFEDLGFQGAAVQDKRVYHRHSSSMDGSTSPFEGDSGAAGDFVKKALAADKLAELALIDPKRAKRILANRQSAARSKERKTRYTGELERKVQTLQTEATTLSAQLTLLQRDTTGLTSENKELKLRLQAMEQQAHLRDALNETLREEVQRLKIATGQVPYANGNNFNRGLQQPVSPFFSQQQQFHNTSAHQAQQLYMSLPSSNGQPPHESMDFM